MAASAASLGTGLADKGTWFKRFRAIDAETDDVDVATTLLMLSINVLVASVCVIQYIAAFGSEDGVIGTHRCQ